MRVNLRLAASPSFNRAIRAGRGTIARLIGGMKSFVRIRESNILELIIHRTLVEGAKDERKEKKEKLLDEPTENSCYKNID